MQCVDAETLAAWADGGLPKPEAVAVELHLSECDRCTAMLATFVRTTPEIPATGSLWQRWHLRWLVPVATAATVAALWVLIPRPEPVPLGDIGYRRRQAGTNTSTNSSDGAAAVAGRRHERAEGRGRQNSIGSRRRSRQTGEPERAVVCTSTRRSARGAAGHTGAPGRGGPSTRGRSRSSRSTDD